MSKRTRLIIILSAAILFVLGLYSYPKFLHWFLIRKEGITYISQGLADQFKQMIFFSLVLAAIPLHAFVLRLIKPVNILISSGILLGLVAGAIFIKRFLLLRDIQRFYTPSINGLDLQTNILLEKYTPELYMFVALIIGFILLILLKSEKILFRNDSINSLAKI